MCYSEIEGNLSELAQRGHFDVIVNYCNCFNLNQNNKSFVEINKWADCSQFPLEHPETNGQINKLGMIDYEVSTYANAEQITLIPFADFDLAVVNAYTQYLPDSAEKTYFDKEAFTICLRKINNVFQGKRVALLKVEDTDMGLYWNQYKEIVKRELADCCVTVIK
jgi:hypothetical protein